MRKEATKSERAEYISKRAFELAVSGDHKDYTAIELALRAEGFDEAPQVLAKEQTRNELNAICVESYKPV